MNEQQAAKPHAVSDGHTSLRIIVSSWACSFVLCDSLLDLHAILDHYALQVIFEEK